MGSLRLSFTKKFLSNAVPKDKCPSDTQEVIKRDLFLSDVPKIRSGSYIMLLSK